MMLQGTQMSYLQSFEKQIDEAKNYTALIRLWEEYCESDELDPLEIVAILKKIKLSEFANPFGKYVEKILPLWELMPQSDLKHETIRLILDLQTTNHESLRQFTFDYLHCLYGSIKDFNDKIRLIGLRTKEQFQGAISHFELLNHMEKGNFVFHSAGWGVGEIVDVSLLREQLKIEFEYVGGMKDLSFANAFKTLTPLSNDHFLSLRFGNPDLLEKRAKENPVEVVKILLRDLGPKTAADIREELCELVIPEKEWAKWWQTARTKIKKDTMVESPIDLKNCFILRANELSHESRLQKFLENNKEAGSLIQLIYSFLRDFPEILKNEEFKLKLQEKLKETLMNPDLTESQALQLHFFLEDLTNEKNQIICYDIIKNAKSIAELLASIEILAFKKRVLVIVKKILPEWKEIFLSLLFAVDQNSMRDSLLEEILNTGMEKELQQALEALIASPGKNPDLFLWYFQKVISQKDLPFCNQEGKSRFFEGFFILLSYVETSPSHKDLIKKMHALLTNGRYAIVRDILKGTNLEMAKEFLLLSTKCHSLEEHDLKILHSLAEVVHPSLAKQGQYDDKSSDFSILWTTEAGFNKAKKRVEQIATVEMLQTAKEIEIARSHGDLRENAEFKSAIEKRNRLQGELKLLSEQLKQARVLTREDISTSYVNPGTVVECKTKQGKEIAYTLLGPWDADPDQYILSCQSKLAQMMRGLTIGSKFQFQGEEFTITGIRSYL